MWASIICNEMSLCFRGHPIQNTAQYAIPNMLIYHGRFALELRTACFRFLLFNACNWWLHYWGFLVAPCDVSLAMFSLDHRLVRLTIDMLLHSYMHRWKHSLFRLQVRVQLVLGGLVLILLHCSLWNTDLQLGNKKWWQTNAVKACILHNTRAIWPLPSSSFNLP